MLSAVCVLVVWLHLWAPVRHCTSEVVSGKLNRGGVRRLHSCCTHWWESLLYIVNWLVMCIIGILDFMHWIVIFIVKHYFSWYILHIHILHVELISSLRHHFLHCIILLIYQSLLWDTILLISCTFQALLLLFLQKIINFIADCEQNTFYYFWHHFYSVFYILWWKLKTNFFQNFLIKSIPVILFLLHWMSIWIVV